MSEIPMSGVRSPETPGSGDIRQIGNIFQAGNELESNRKWNQ